MNAPFDWNVTSQRHNPAGLPQPRFGSDDVATPPRCTSSVTHGALFFALCAKVWDGVPPVFDDGLSPTLHPQIGLPILGQSTLRIGRY